jgi:hypothetical protein
MIRERTLTKMVCCATIAFFSVACGADRPPGVIEGPARALPPAPPGEKQILFGDLHVHTTYSPDAFSAELPVMGLQGVHTPADACDFARHCAALDFFSYNDHAESLIPEHWRATKEVARQCNALADPEHPDLVAFMGFEWSQIGATGAEHWGHKNVVFPGLADGELPARPIGSLPEGGKLFGELLGPVVGVCWIDPLGWKEYSDLGWLLERMQAIPDCPAGVPVRELPEECTEFAETPAALYAKLDDWGFPALVIPHGNAWGVYSPGDTAWDKSLDPAQHDPERQRLLEVMSGHGNSEEYRTFRPTEQTPDGYECPAPTEDHLPCCWQAGEIMRSRCGELPAAECEARVAEARRLAAAAGANVRLVFPDAPAEEWLDCGQCRDCFKPSLSYRPQGSSQYALALSNLEAQGADGRPLRFRFGFIASTDDHTARPGTGYKQYERRKMTFATGVRSQRFLDLWRRSQDMEDPQRPQSPPARQITSDAERLASFAYPGGIVAVHAQGRTREAIWDALVRREVYGTSGPRMLLWFDLANAPAAPAPMGSELELAETPRFSVRAAGAFVQKPGCPPESERALSPERLDYLCAGECENPSDLRHPITAIEVVRIRPQVAAGEPVDALIEDPWRRFACAPDPAGCSVRFEDPDFARDGRDSVYYVRALQAPTPAINGANLRTRFDAAGRAVAIEPCYGDFRTPFADDCLAPVQERAWSSPIYLNHPAALAREEAP